MPYEPRARNDHSQIDRREDGERRHCRTSQAAHQVTDECGGDHHRPRRDQAHRHGIQELALGEPVMLVDDTLLEEGHDSQPAPEDERARLEEEQPKRHERATCRGPCQNLEA